jgi:hypothetical protein
LFALYSPILESVLYRSCHVSFTDSEGVQHSVLVSAKPPWNLSPHSDTVVFANGTFGPATRLTIRVKAPEEEHIVTVSKLNSWLDGGAKSPNEQMQKKRLKERLTKR